MLLSRPFELHLLEQNKRRVEQAVAWGVMLWIALNVCSASYLAPLMVHGRTRNALERGSFMH